jgi:membrane-associated phospholipid phosphatase
LLLAYAESIRGSRLLSIARDWYPTPLMLLAYREMGWFARAHLNTSLEDAWVVWDRLALNEWGVRVVIEFLGPLLPSLLEISYSLVYTIAPFSMAMFYAAHRRQRLDSFLFVFLIGILSAYALFPYFPSEPPWTVFPGEDVPTYATPFRRLNAGLLSRWGIHTSVFPSAHVSGAFSAAFAMMRYLPEKRWVGRLLLAMAVSIATATVYGRYHYLVDALAGLTISLAALGFGVLADRRRLH